MKASTTRLLLLGTGFLAVTLLSGCALTKDYINLAYTPQANAARVEGAEAVSVTVGVSDARNIKDRVGAKKNAYGMEMAAIIAKEDVATTLKNALEAELANRGFRLTEGGVVVAAELSKFYNDFKVGFWSGAAVAEVVMNVQLKKADGSIGFSRLVAGAGSKEHIQLASGTNAKVALDAALQDAVGKLFNDPAFVDALLKAARP